MYKNIKSKKGVSTLMTVAVMGLVATLVVLIAGKSVLINQEVVGNVQQSNVAVAAANGSLNRAIGDLLNNIVLNAPTDWDTRTTNDFRDGTMNEQYIGAGFDSIEATSINGHTVTIEMYRNTINKSVVEVVSTAVNGNSRSTVSERIYLTFNTNNAPIVFDSDFNGENFVTKGCLDSNGTPEIFSSVSDLTQAILTTGSAACKNAIMGMHGAAGLNIHALDGSILELPDMSSSEFDSYVNTDTSMTTAWDYVFGSGFTQTLFQDLAGNSTNWFLEQTFSKTVNTEVVSYSATPNLYACTPDHPEVYCSRESMAGACPAGVDAEGNSPDCSSTYHKIINYNNMPSYPASAINVVTNYVKTETTPGSSVVSEVTSCTPGVSGSETTTCSAGHYYRKDFTITSSTAFNKKLAINVSGINGDGSGANIISDVNITLTQNLNACPATDTNDSDGTLKICDAANKVKNSTGVLSTTSTRYDGLVPASGSRFSITYGSPTHTGYVVLNQQFYDKTVVTAPVVSTSNVTSCTPGISGGVTTTCEVGSYNYTLDLSGAVNCLPLGGTLVSCEPESSGYKVFTRFNKNTPVVSTSTENSDVCSAGTTTEGGPAPGTVTTTETTCTELEVPVQKEITLYFDYVDADGKINNTANVLGGLEEVTTAGRPSNENNIHIVMFNGSCPPKLNGAGAVFYGIAYTTRTDCDMNGWGNGEMHGSIVAEGDIDQVNANTEYSKLLNFNNLKSALANATEADVSKAIKVTRLPGTWRKE